MSGRGERAGRHGERGADREHRQVHAARIDAEHFDHLGLFGGGADDRARPGALDPAEQRGGQAEAHRDDDESDTPHS